MKLDALLDDIRANPDDDQPRLVWADAVGGERGEFVVLQCELARGGHTPARARELRTRHAELIGAHGQRWSGLESFKNFIRRCVYRRGFVDAVEISLELPNLGWLVERLPLLRSLNVSFATLADIDRLLAQKAPLAQLQALALHLPHHGVREVRRLADVDLTQLRAFGISGIAHGDDPVLDLPRVERLEVAFRRGGAFTDAYAQRMFAAAPQLRALHVGFHGADLRLPTGLVELGIEARPETLETLAEQAPTLERLRLGGVVGTQIEVLATLPKLRALDLGDALLGDENGSPLNHATNLALASLPLPALRELSWSRYSDKSEIDTLIANVGPQLEQLDLDMKRHVPSPGFRRSESTWSHELLLPDVRPSEPWLIGSLVRFERMRAEGEPLKKR